MTPEENFIREYLQYDQDTGAGSYEKMYSAIKVLDWEKVKPHILKLKYFYFLKSSYWHIISDEIKRRDNWQCSCGGRENLQVHHTEEGDRYHGEEHLLQGLACLCKKCHQSLHGISIKVSEKKRHRNGQKEEILSQLSFYPGRVAEESIGGSSFALTRKLLVELEHENKVVIERGLYDGWKVHRT